MKKSIVILSLGALSMTFFAFSPAANPMITPLANGNYEAFDLRMAPHHEDELAAIEVPDLYPDYAVKGFLYRCKSTTSRKFTAVTFIGSGCATAAFEVISPELDAIGAPVRPLVDQILQKYML